MVLVDTSVWVAHFRSGDVGLEALLEEAHVVSHPFIVGELACGNLKNRTGILSLLQALPAAVLVDHEEVMFFIENHGLMGKGLGYIDMHLIASAVMTRVPIWTLDKELNGVCSKLGIVSR
jgi:predicted nucleic acid-binding protein